VDESESIAPIAASAASRMSSRRESAASRKRLAKASRREGGFAFFILCGILLKIINKQKII